MILTRLVPALLCSLIIVMSSCVTERAQPALEYPAVPNQTSFLIKKIDYDEHGRPLFNTTLHNRPKKTGEQFTIVHAVNGRPSRSYDIAIIQQQKADIGKPFAVIYEWTGKGFAGGLALSQGLYPNGVVVQSRDEALGYLTIKAAPLVIGGVTGFVIGVVASIPATAVELSHVIVNARESVIGYTVYEYDEKGRIRFMKLYPPDEHAPELVKTEFFYAGESVVPVKTEVTSVVEKTVREIR